MNSEEHDSPSSGWKNFYIYIIDHLKINSIVFSLLFLTIIIYVFFIMPKEYTAETSLLPNSASGSQLLPGNLSSVASFAGLNFQDLSIKSPEMYQGLIYSRSVLKDILYKDYVFVQDSMETQMKLIDFLEIEGKTEEERFQKSLKAFREGILNFNIDDDNNIMTVSVTLENPMLAALVCNALVKRLDKVVTLKVQSEFDNQIGFINKRLAELHDSLAISERELLNFLEENSDPTLPKFQVEQAKLRRQLDMKAAIYIELRKQLEILRLQNFIYLSPVKVLDKASPPYRKSKPKRILTVIKFLFLVGILQVSINGGFFIYNRLTAVYTESKGK